MEKGMRVRRFVKRIVALAGAAVMAGAIASAFTLNELKSKFVTDGSVSATLTVGKYDPAKVAAAAVNIYAALLESTKREVSAEAGKVVIEKGVEIAGAVPLYKETNKIYLNDKLDKVYNVISDGLVFGSATYKDSAGKEYDYVLKIYLGTSATGDGFTVSFKDRPDTTSRDPTVLLDGHANYIPLYTLEVRFYSEIDTKKVKGTTIKLFGKEYVIDEIGSSYWKLREAATTKTLKPGESIEFEGKTIKLVDVVEETVDGLKKYAAVVEVDGETKKIVEETSEKVGGIDIYVKDAYVSTTQQGVAYAEIMVGGKLIELAQGSRAKVGGTEIKNTMVDVANNKTLKLKVYVSDESTKNILVHGQEFKDPLFGTFKLTFQSVDLKSGKYLVKIEGGQYARITFVDYLGKSQTLDIAEIKDNKVFLKKKFVPIEYHNSSVVNVVTETSAVDPSKYYNLLVYASDANPTSRYFIVNDNDAKETYIFEVISVDTGGNKIKVKEILSGKEIEVSYSGTTGAGTIEWGGKAIEFNVTEGDVVGVSVNGSHVINVVDAAGDISIWGKDEYKITIDLTDPDTANTGTWPQIYKIRVSEPTTIVGPTPTTIDVNITKDSGGDYVDVVGLIGITEVAGENNYYYYLTQAGTYVERLAATQSNTGDGRVEIYVTPEAKWYDIKLAPTEAAAETVTVEYAVGEEIPGVGKVKGFTGVEAITYGSVSLEVKEETLGDKSIVVGTTLGNEKVTELLGRITPEAGKAIIKLMEKEGKPIVLIAGVSVDDVIRASEWLANIIKTGEYGELADAEAIEYDTAAGTATKISE